MEAKYTPGPWVQLHLTDGTVDIDGPDDELICQIPVLGVSAEAKIANAKLITLAPELAECLRDLRDFQNGPHLSRYAAEWNEAMEKAAELLQRAGA